MLETLDGIWHHERLAREQPLSPEERLRFHQEDSGPLMKTLHDWMEAQLAERNTEPNSGRGKAIRYMLRHWTPLILFLREPGTPIYFTELLRHAEELKRNPSEWIALELPRDAGAAARPAAA